MRASVIATTYNQPEDLRLCLLTLARQTFTGFEVVVADDGSGPETQAVIADARARFGDRLKHVWHPDEGYRKAKIVNAAVRASSGQTLIFIDADVIVDPRFVEDHLALSGERTLVMGRRVDLSPAASTWARSHPEQLFSAHHRLRVLLSGIPKNGSHGVRRALRLTHPIWVKGLGLDRVPDLLGSNFSICRDLFSEVGGLDESLEHYWGEDGDLFIRVRARGARIIGRKSFAVQLHLWHPRRNPPPGAEEAYRARVNGDAAGIADSSRA